MRSRLDSRLLTVGASFIGLYLVRDAESFGQSSARWKIYPDDRRSSG